jgi:hypothetical protein
MKQLNSIYYVIFFIFLFAIVGFTIIYFIFRNKDENKNKKDDVLRSFKSPLNELLYCSDDFSKFFISITLMNQFESYSNDLRKYLNYNDEQIKREHNDLIFGGDGTSAKVMYDKSKNNTLWELLIKSGLCKSKGFLTTFGIYRQKFLNDPKSVDCKKYFKMLENIDFNSPQVWENINNDYLEWRKQNPHAGEDIF